MRRTRLEILLEMLEKCVKPRKFTHLMYDLRLSFTLMRACMMKLEKVGLLSVKRGSKEVILTTTEKGQEVLTKYKAYFDALIRELRFAE